MVGQRLSSLSVEGTVDTSDDFLDSLNDLIVAGGIQDKGNVTDTMEVNPQDEDQLGVSTEPSDRRIFLKREWRR